MSTHFVPPAAPVAVLDRSALSRDELVNLLADLERQKVWIDAQELHALAALAAAPPLAWESPQQGVARQWVRDEVGCALRISSWSAAARLDTAAAATRLPATLAVLAAGEVSMTHVRIIVDAVEKLDDGPAAQVEARVLAPF